MKSLLCIVIVLLFSIPSVFAEEYPILSKSIFGVNLGESEASFRQKCKNINKTPIIVDFGDKYYPGKMLKISGAINCNDAIEETWVSFFHDQISCIFLYFKDKSIDNSIVLEFSLGEKYTSMDDTTDGLLRKSGIVAFSSFIDNESITMKLQHGDSVIEGIYEFIVLEYRYKKIFWDSFDENHELKKQKVFDDL